MKTELKIDGMTCGHCVQTVQRALTSVPGVTQVNINLPTGRATVEATRVSDEDLLRAVREEGYRAEVA